MVNWLKYKYKIIKFYERINKKKLASDCDITV